MTDMTFGTFSKLLIGEWVGQRHKGGLEHEEVRSQWQIALEGSFLLEHWHTAGSGGIPEPTAEAFFRVSDSGSRRGWHADPGELRGHEAR